MRIGIDGRYIQDQYHGVGRYIYEIAAQLAQNSPDQQLVIFHNPSYTNTRFDLEALGSNVKLVKTSLRLFWPQQQLLWPRLLQQHHIELFHSPFFEIPWLAPCPVVVTIHDLIFDRYPNYMPQRHLRLYYRLLTKISVQKSAKIISVSEATKRDLIALYNVAPAKISVTPEATASDFQRVSPEQAEAVRTRYNLPHRFVLTVGTMRPQKNIPTLIRAFAKMAPHTNAALVLAGKADKRWPDEISPLIRKLNLRGRVIQPGHIAEADLPALYTLAEVFAFPSLIEGFGLPPLEAMACGTAVVVSNTSSLPEVVGDAGLLVDPHNAQALAEGLLAILKKPRYRIELENRSLMRAAQFNWQRTAQLTKQAYQVALRNEN